MASTFFTCRTIPPPVRTRIPTKCVYGKMSIQSAAPLYKNGLYKMTKPKPIFWGRTCLAQNDGLCRARALPFCAGSFKRDVEPHTPPFHLHSQSFDPCLTIPRLHGDRKKCHISGQNVERSLGQTFCKVSFRVSFSVIATPRPSSYFGHLQFCPTCELSTISSRLHGGDRKKASHLRTKFRIWKGTS